MREILKAPCRKFGMEPTNKKTIKKDIRVPLAKVQRKKKNRQKFRVTTKGIQSLAKMQKQCPNINITIAMNSKRYNCKASPSVDYNLTDLDEESVSEKIQQMDLKIAEQNK